MKAKEAARHSATKEKIQEAMARPQAGGYSDPYAKVEKPVIPSKEKESDKEMEELEEISIAGRTKMTVPKKGSQDSLVDPALDPSSFSESTEEQKEAAARKVREAEAKAELNVILKKAPGMFCFREGLFLRG